MPKNKEEWVMQTKKGYDFFEASSSFQKSIRRNLEEEALYWMTEFLNAGMDNYLWKRILIIVMEDVGLAEPNAPAIVNGLYEIYKDMKKRKDEHWKLAIIQSVIYLCRAKKSRLVDWTKNCELHYHDSYNLEVPDFALDIHTKRGRMMGKTVNDFFVEGSKLEPHTPLEHEEERKEKNWNHAKMSKQEQKDHKTHTKIEGKIETSPSVSGDFNTDNHSKDDTPDKQANIGLFDE